MKQDLKTHFRDTVAQLHKLIDAIRKEQGEELDLPAPYRIREATPSQLAAAQEVEAELQKVRAIVALMSVVY